MSLSHLDRFIALKDAIEIACLELKTPEPTHVAIYFPCETRMGSFNLFYVDVSVGSIDISSLIFPKNDKDLRSALAKTVFPADFSGPKLTFLLDQPKRCIQGGTWTLMDPETLEPRVFQDRLVLTSFGRRRAEVA